MTDPMIILRKDFEAYIDDWIDLSVNVTNHQASGLKSREYDLRLCVEFLREKKMDEITPSRLAVDAVVVLSPSSAFAILRIWVD